MTRSESETDRVDAATGPPMRGTDGDASPSTSTGVPDLLAAISARIGEVWAASLAALLTAVAAGFPMIYQLDPGLAEREGFWRSARWFLLAMWVLLLFTIAFRITLTQLRSGNRLEQKTGELGQQLRDALVAANRQFSDNLLSWRDNVAAMRQISNGITQTMDSLAHMQRSIDMSSAQREILDKLQRAATLPIPELPPLPPPALIYLFLATRRRPLAQRLLVPSVEVAGDPALSQKLVNLLDLNAVTDDRDLRRVPISRRHRSVLPLEWRDRDTALIVPVLSGEDGDTIGTLVVALSDQEIDSAARELAVAERCRNMADDIWQTLLHVGKMAPPTPSDDGGVGE